MVSCLSFPSAPLKIGWVKMLLNINPSRLLAASLKIILVIRIVVVTPDHIWCCPGPFRNRVSIEPYVSLPRNRSPPDSMRTSRRRAPAGRIPGNELTVRTAPSMRAFYRHTWLGRLVHPPSDRSVHRAALTTRKQWFPPELIPYIGTLTSDIEIQDLCWCL